MDDFRLSLSYGHCSHVSGKVAIYVHVWSYLLNYDVWICIVGLVVMMFLLRLHPLVERVRLRATMDGLLNL